jgi:hypothetical protein
MRGASRGLPDDQQRRATPARMSHIRPMNLAALRERLSHSRHVRRLAQARFDWQCRGVLETPPLRLAAAPVSVVSMVRTEHLRMYLLAIKSFARRIAVGQVVVMDDGSLTPDDQALIRRHVPQVEIVFLPGIATAPCPRGGCWERLLFILDRTADGYVVQLDSDVLSLGELPAIAACIEANRAFTLSSGEGFSVVSFEEATVRVAAEDPSALQTACEQALASLQDSDGLIGRRYVRGSAGFAGFPRGGATRAAAEAFSVAMERRLGARWQGWGTEQVASNHIVASLPDGQLLPWPDYACYYPHIDPGEARLLHFIGSWRFAGGAYARAGRRVIAELRAG